MKIHFRGALSGYLNHSLDNNYVYIHERYVSPSHVLARDCVTLQMVTGDKVVFCVTEEEDNVYNMKVGKGKGNFVQNVLVFHSCTSFKKKSLQYILFWKVPNQSWYR